MKKKGRDISTATKDGEHRAEDFRGDGFGLEARGVVAVVRRDNNGGYVRWCH